MSAYRRLQSEIQASRRIAIERDLQLSRRYDLQRLERQRDYLRLRDAQKFRAEQEYEDYRLRRAEQHRIAQQQAIQQRISREVASREYEVRVQAERLARQTRDKQFFISQQLEEQAEIRRAETLAISRKAQLNRKQQIKSSIDKENLAILDEQKIQQKLERELSQIEIKIGTIYDEREARKRKQLVQLQELDKESFRLKQAMRSSKVQQKALQESLAELSKVIV